METWFKQSRRKPLVIRGARQVGKTWLVRDFAQRKSLDLIELNFERDPLLVDAFASNDPKHIIQELELVTSRRIETGSVLLFLDEIQAAPQLLAKLRWFHEELPRLAVVAAGSLLDFALAEHSFSMPVGRIQYLHLEPLSFEEFLEAESQSIQLEKLKSWPPNAQAHISDTLHSKLLDTFRNYLLVGGMPEAVARWNDEKSFLACAEAHHSLLETFRDDFAKYAGRVPHHRIARVFESVPRQLGCKFKYATVPGEERAEAIKQALELLCKARLCHRIHSTHAQGLPLGAETNERMFKVSFLDTGLASASSGLWQGKPTSVANLTLANQGALAEQFVAQSLRTNMPSFQESALHYWSRERRGSEAEVDFVISHGSHIIPIEVKAGTTGTLKSLHLFMAERQLPLAIRVNGDKPSLNPVDAKTQTGKAARYQLLSLPFYLVGQIPRLIEDVPL